MTTQAGVILVFSTLNGTNSQILPPKRYDEHLRHFFRGVPPRPPARAAQYILNLGMRWIDPEFGHMVDIPINSVYEEYTQNLGMWWIYPDFGYIAEIF